MKLSSYVIMMLSRGDIIIINQKVGVKNELLGVLV